MFAGFRIVLAVVVYRLRNLEMANMAAGVSIAVALRLSPVEIVVRTLFAFVLNALVYLNNDYVDVEIDLRSADKDTSKARYLAEHKRTAFVAQLVLAAGLAIWAVLYDVGLLVPLIAGGGVCWWYSAQLKHTPGMDIVAMGIWGLTMPLIGSPLDNTLGLAMVLQLGLFSCVFETIQVLRDADEDSKDGVRTTGVVLGKKRTLMLAKVLMIPVTVYAALYLHPIAAAITFVALFVPFVPANIERYWTRIKLVYGVAWLVICAWVFFNGESSGLFASIRADATAPTP